MEIGFSKGGCWAISNNPSKWTSRLSRFPVGSSDDAFHSPQAAAESPAKPQPVFKEPAARPVRPSQLLHDGGGGGISSNNSSSGSSGGSSSSTIEKRRRKLEELRRRMLTDDEEAGGGGHVSPPGSRPSSAEGVYAANKASHPFKWGIIIKKSSPLKKKRARNHWNGGNKSLNRTCKYRNSKKITLFPVKKQSMDKGMATEFAKCYSIVTNRQRFDCY